MKAEVASDTLVALSRNHFSLVMYELQHHLKPLDLTDEFVIITLAKLANGNGRARTNPRGPGLRPLGPARRCLLLSGAPPACPRLLPPPRPRFASLSPASLLFLSTRLSPLLRFSFLSLIRFCCPVSSKSLSSLPPRPASPARPGRCLCPSSSSVPPFFPLFLPLLSCLPLRPLPAPSFDPTLTSTPFPVAPEAQRCPLALCREAGSGWVVLLALRLLTPLPAASPHRSVRVHAIHGHHPGDHLHDAETRQRSQDAAGDLRRYVGVSNKRRGLHVFPNVCSGCCSVWPLWPPGQAA